MKFLLVFLTGLISIEALPRNHVTHEIQSVSQILADRYARRPDPRINTDFICTQTRDTFSPKYTISIKRTSGMALPWNDRENLQVVIENGGEDTVLKILRNESSGERCHVTMTFRGTDVRSISIHEPHDVDCETRPIQTYDANFGFDARSIQRHGTLDFSVSQLTNLLSQSGDLVERLHTVSSPCCSGDLTRCPSLRGGATHQIPVSTGSGTTQ